MGKIVNVNHVDLSRDLVGDLPGDLLVLVGAIYSSI